MLIRLLALRLYHIVDQLQELILEEGVAWVTMETLLLRVLGQALSLPVCLEKPYSVPAWVLQRG